MSTRPYLAPQPVIIDGDMTTAITSLATILQQKSMANYGASWMGAAPVGTLSVEGSNDYSLDAKGNVSNPGTWTTLVLNFNGAPVTSIPVSGSPGTAMIDITAISAFAIRLVFTPTSGSGALQALICSKVQ